jgi:hypothetical protein
MHAVLSLALLLVVLEVRMTEPVAAIGDAASPLAAPSSTSNRDNASHTGISSSSSCLFTQKDVRAQDLDAIKKACGECEKCCCTGLQLPQGRIACAAAHACSAAHGIGRSS